MLSRLHTMFRILPVATFAATLWSGCGPGGNGNPSCGNGVVDTGEQCDDGADNGDVPNACRTTCVLPACGDGFIDDGSGEECDPPNGANCGPTCMFVVAVCGDGMIDPGEECDPPVIDFCTASCMLVPPPPMCGNGALEGMEECDDGNLISGDGCSATCFMEASGPNIGAPCVDVSQCNAGGTGLTPRCLLEVGDALGITFPGGMCAATGCDEMLAPCPISTDPVTGAPVDAICVTLDGTPTCLPTCTPGPGGNGSCRSDVAGAMSELAWTCAIDFFDADQGFCYVGCATDDACNPGSICLIPENVCVNDSPTPGGSCLASGTCAGAPATVCTMPSDCPADCTGACAGDATTSCIGDGDCAPVCDLTAGTCANDGVTACTMPADPVCTATCDLSAGVCPDGTTVCTMAADPACSGVCNITSTCDNNGRTCTVNADCDVRIGDPCLDNTDCPQYASCLGDPGDAMFFQDAFLNGYCTIIGCESYTGLAEFACPAGTFCPAANGFNGGSNNYCAPLCTVDSSDAFTECNGVRNSAGEDHYSCHEQFPDASGTGLTDFFDTDGAAGFCHPCTGFWLDTMMECP